MKPTLLILAAGMGSRYGGLKQVDELGPHGEALIEYSIYDAVRAGFGKVVFVIRKNIEDVFKQKIGDQFTGKIQVEYAFQEFDSSIEGITEWPEREKPWGTAHAVLVARHLINEPFAVINADDYYGISGFESMARFLEEKCSPDHYSMVGYQLDKTLSDAGHVNRGVCSMDEDGFLTDVEERMKIQRHEDGSITYQGEQGERPFLQPETLVSMNFWGFHPKIFEYMHHDFIAFVEAHRDQPRAEFFIPLVANRLIKEGKVKFSVLPSADKWYGVTYQEDKPMVKEAFERLTEAGRYPEQLWT